MAVVKEVKRKGIESVTIELTEREARMVKVLTGLGSFHLTYEGQQQLRNVGFAGSPCDDAVNVHFPLTEALR